MEMVYRLKKIFILGAVALTFVALPAQAQQEGVSPLLGEITKQNQQFSGEQGAGYGNTGDDPRLIAAELIRIFITFLGILMTTYTVYGGYLLLSSAGSEERVTKAKSILVHGVIGISVVFFSYSTAYFVVKTVWYAQSPDNEFVSFFKWGTIKGVPSGSHNDPLDGKRDPLEQNIPTFKFGDPQQ